MSFNHIYQSLHRLPAVGWSGGFVVGRSPAHLGIAILVGLLSTLALSAQTPTAYNQTNSMVRVFNAGRVNTDDMEFCPAIYENGLVYVSRYKSGPTDPKTGETFFELFYAELNPDGMPGKPQAFSSELNGSYNEGPVTFNRNYDRIFFTRNNTQGNLRRANSQGKVGLKIYEARRGLYDWEDVKELPFNDDSYTCFHPTLSVDEQRLYFASDMPNGHGGFDIYFVVWNGNGWGPPVNLGPSINTAKNDVFPFIHDSGTLFFASDGYSGLGGMDLYMVNVAGNMWGQVVNLGEPFCSPADDLGLVMQPDGQRGYFTSSRPGGYGRDDIYVFEAPQGLRGMNAAPPQSAIVRVYDAASSRRMAGAAVRLYELGHDGLPINNELYTTELAPSDQRTGEMSMKLVRQSTDQLPPARIISDRNGEAAISTQPSHEYLLLVSKEGFMDRELRFRVTEQGTDQPLEIMMNASNCITLNGVLRTNTSAKPIPNATVKVRSECNGRVETLSTNIKGEFTTCLEIGCDFVIISSKEGYQGNEAKVTTVRLRGSRSLEAIISLQPMSDAALREPIATGTVIIIDDIMYDFGKSDIRRGNSRQLEALLQLMQDYPSMVIELSAHTDSRGDGNYNMSLSLRRAESVKEFLMDRGISPNRVKAVGYGETFLRNGCTNNAPCSEAEHGVNRRAEVKILSINEDLR